MRRNSQMPRVRGFLPGRTWPTVLAMTDAPNLQPPREPEIEMIGRIAHEALRIGRGIIWGGGVAAMVYGYQQFVAPYEEAAQSGATESVMPSAMGTVWFTLGIPWILPTCWMLARKNGRIGMLIGYALCWFVPIVLPDDGNYGFILRMFTTGVAFSTLLVWQTLWKLTNPNRQTPQQASGNT